MGKAIRAVNTVILNFVIDSQMGWMVEGESAALPSESLPLLSGTY